MVASSAMSLHFLMRAIKLNSTKKLVNLKQTKSLQSSVIFSIQHTNISTTSPNRFEIKLSNKNQAASAPSSQTVIPPPQFDGQPKVYSPKIEQLVNEIAQLNLIEVSDLNELLRKKLNIKDVPMSYAAMQPTGAAQPAAKKEEEEPEEQAPKAVKSSFRLKLVKYDEAKKVALIKEIKSVSENMNLVQAKKFIESVPQVLRDNVSKEDAEKLKAQLEKVGAVLEIE